MTHKTEKLRAIFRDGRKGQYTIGVWDLLITDPNVEVIIDGETGEVLYECHESETMNDLKTLLFTRTREALETYVRIKAQEGEERTEDYILARRTFCTLYQLVEESGLEEEYYAWKGENK